MTSGERIVQIEVGQEMRKSFIDYAMSVIVSRAIPDVRDGLKPVHRRIIYGMFEEGLRPDGRYRKSANTVGYVMGNYHPHGDSAIYEAMVRLAQSQASRYPLVDGHGNFGDLDNPPAAMRYTEAKLARISMEMLGGQKGTDEEPLEIASETFDDRPNFDDRKREPVVLPTRVPVLLLNGSSGIAVGMATNIPPHNLTEVINGCLAKIDTPELDSRALMQYIKGPDFPMGGVIIGTSGIEEAYTTGRGSIPVRGLAVIEQLEGRGRANRMAIIVTQLPYMIGPEAFTKRVADLVKDEKITGVADVNDETDRNGVRVVIELKRDAHPEVVLNNLYKQTQLQQSFPVNTLALVRGRPATLKLEDLVQEFIDHRIDVVTRRTKYYLAKAESEAHILEGLLKALKNIDRVIQIIRGAKNSEQAAQELMKEFEMSEAQTKAVLEMQLRRLAAMEAQAIKDKYDSVMKRIKDYKDILASRQRVLDIIKVELTEIRDKYGDERRTQIQRGAGDLDITAKDLTPNEPMAVFITKQDYVKRVPLDTFKRQNRNTRGVTGVKTKDEDDLQHFFIANMHDKLLVFTNRGQVYSVDVMNIPEAGRNARGLPIVNLVSVSQDETVTTVIPVSEFAESSYFVMLTRQANIKKVSMSEFESIRRSGIIAITLQDGDELGWVRTSNGKSDIIIGTSDGMCIRYSEDEVRPLGRTARGVRAITLREGDQIVGFDVLEATPESAILVVTNDGFGKRVKMDEFRQQGRGGVGIIGTKFKNAQSKLAALRVVEPGDQVMIATANGVVVRQSTDEISSQGRMATGVRLQQLGENDSVMSVTPIVNPDETSEGDAPAATSGGEGDTPKASASDVAPDGGEDTGIIDGGEE